MYYFWPERSKCSKGDVLSTEQKLIQKVLYLYNFWSEHSGCSARKVMFLVKQNNMIQMSYICAIFDMSTLGVDRGQVNSNEKLMVG